MKNILITGGLHGDEPTGIEVARFFEKEKSEVSGLICNLEAIKIGKRLIETDLNRSFNVQVPISLEEKLAEEISRIVKKFSLVIDIHNTRATGTTCAIVVNKPNDLQIKLAKYFGFKKITIMPPSGSLISLKPEASISFEIATDSIEKYSAKKLIDKISRLEIDDVEKQKNGQAKIYIFVNKILRSTLNRLELDKNQFGNFKQLNNSQKNKLGLEKNGSYYPIFFKREEDEKVAFTLVKGIDVK